LERKKKIKPTPEKYQNSNALHTNFYDTFSEIMNDITSGGIIKPIKFDKDNDLHLKMVEIIAQIRCSCFKIQYDSNLQEIQKIAGAEPSIITSTAISAGYSAMYLYLLAAHRLGKKELQFMQPVINISSMTFSNDIPVEPYSDDSFLELRSPSKIDYKTFKKIIEKKTKNILWTEKEMKLNENLLSITIVDKCFVNEEKNVFPDLDNPPMNQLIRINENVDLTLRLVVKNNVKKKAKYIFIRFTLKNKSKEKKESFKGYRYEDKIQGYGKKTYDNGDIYEGEWLDDKRNGIGKMHYTNNTTYDGMWKNDERNGEGTIYYPNSKIFKGDWVSDKRNGKGLVVYPEKNIQFEGEWKNDKKHGLGKYMFENKVIYQQFFNGKKKIFFSRY